MDIFGGQLLNEVICGSCRNASWSFDMFMDISLPIPTRTSRGTCRLKDCFRAYTENEDMSGDYRCEKCKRSGNISRRLHMYY